MHTRRLNTATLLLLAILAVSGCVSVPKAVDEELTTNISVADVQQNESTHTGTQVRWGGTIAGLSNNSDSTDILVVSRDLGSNARPRRSDQSTGRFIARVTGFVEPEVYVDGREITITGSISGIEKQLIGATEYPYPVVDVNGIHLWSKRDTTRYRYPYPYHGYPYHPHHPFYHPHDHWFDHGPHSSIYGHFVF